MKAIINKSWGFFFTFFIWTLFSCSTHDSSPDKKSSVPDIEKKQNKIDHFILKADFIKDTSISLWINLSEKYNKLSQEISYSRGEGFTLINIGLYNIYQKKYILGLDFFHKALDISEKSNDLFIKCIALKSIGIMFMYLESNDQALEYFNLSLLTAVQDKDTANIIESLLGIGQVYQEKKENKKAFSKIFYALYLAEKFAQTRPQEFSYKTVGVYFINNKQYHRARYYLKKLEKIYWKNNKKLDLSSLFTLYAHIDQLENDHQSALKNNFKAKQIRKSESNTELVASSLINIGNCYLLMKKYDSSEYFFEAGLKIAIDSNNNHVKQYCYSKLCELYSARNDYKKALFYLSQSIICQDSVNIERKLSDIALYETKQAIFEGEKKIEIVKAENQAQKLQLKYNRIQIISLVCFTLFLLGTVYYVYRQFIRNKRSKIILENLNRKLDKEIEDRKIIEAQLTTSEALHRFLTDNALDVISRIDNKYRYVYISPSCLSIYGYTQQEMLDMEDIFFRNEEMIRRGLRSKFDEMIASKTPMKFTYQINKKDGTPFWVESHLNPIFDQESGEFRELISVSRDVSDRIRYEESLIETAKQKEFLMREIHHRTKNNFAILISLLNIQKYQSKDRELFGIINDLQTRIRTMVIIHEQLHRSNSVDLVAFGPYVKNLSNIISSAFRKEGITLHLDIAECQLHIETALPLGLIVNELLTNSYKYAFSDREKGNIHIRLSSVIDLGDKLKWRELVIEDDGIGLPDSFDLTNSNSMGSLIIVTLTAQIHATLEFSGTAGASFRILFPENQDHG